MLRSPKEQNKPGLPGADVKQREPSGWQCRTSAMVANLHFAV